MGQVIAFSEFDEFYSSLAGGQYANGTILDTNILIGLSYEIKSNYEELNEFFASIEKHNIQYFATVNTRSEFLDFHRRLLMTENLRDLAEGDSKLKISSAAKAQIQVQSGQLKNSEKRGSDPVFNDSQIKKIKSSFSAGQHSGQAGWLYLCEKFLDNKLSEIDQALKDRGVQYISQHDELQKEFFHAVIEWPGAIELAEQTSLGLADAMILNAAQCSRFPFIISSDFDIGYATLASSELKNVVVPDSVAKKFRSYHFEVE